MSKKQETQSKLLLPDSCSSTETQPMNGPASARKISQTSLDCFRRIISQEQRYQSKEHIIIQEDQHATYGQ